MFISRTTNAPPPAQAEPTALLGFVGGDFAPRIAAIWPAPHAPFLTAPAARRHLVCLALAQGREAAAPAALVARLTRAIPLAIGAASHGLARALGRLGDVAWPAADYRRLLALLADRRAAKVIWHAGALGPDLLRILATLPPPMAGAGQLAGVLDPAAAAVVREAYEVIRFRSGPVAAERAAARWAGTGSTASLFDAVRDELYPEPPPPPHPGTAWLRPLSTKRALRSAAKRFGNCLAEQLPYACSGWMAYYEWLGRPGAVVELGRDHVFGWRLEQARLAGNAPLTDETRDALAAELALMGVHVGRSGWELERAIASQGRVPFPLRPLEQALAEVFGAGGMTP